MYSIMDMNLKDPIFWAFLLVAALVVFTVLIFVQLSKGKV